MCKKARKQIGMLYRNFYQFFDSSSLLRLYISLIWPHIEYGCVIWDSYFLKIYVKAFKNIQKCSLEFVLRMLWPLAQLKWPPSPVHQKGVFETMLTFQSISYYLWQSCFPMFPSFQEVLFIPKLSTKFRSVFAPYMLDHSFKFSFFYYLLWLGIFLILM